MRPQADRLAQIGGFVGGSSRDMEDAAKRTATFTERTAKAVEKIQTAPKVSAEGIKF